MRHKAVVRFGLLIVMAALVVVPVISCAPEQAAPEPVEGKKVITVFELCTLTGAGSETSGPIEVWMIEFMKEHIYDLELLPDDVRIQFLWSDTQYDVAKAVSEYKRFAMATPKPVIWWGTASGYYEALYPTTAQEEIPAMSFAPGSGVAFYPPAWSFLVKPVYMELWCAYLDWFKANWKEDRAPRIAHVTCDHPMGTAFMTPAATAYAEKLGFEIVASELTPFVVLDYSPYLLKAKDAGADIVAYNWTQASMSVMLKDAERLGMLPDVQFVSGPDAAAPVVVDIAGKAAEGYQSIQPYAAVWEDKPGPKFMYDTWAASGSPDDAMLGAGQAYATATVAIEGIRLAGEKVGYENITGADMKAALESIKNFETDGFTAPISYSPNERRGLRHTKVYEVQGGEFLPITDWLECPDLLPSIAD